MRVKGLPPELKDLELLLRNLDFANNFSSPEVTLEIGPGEEVSFANRLVGANGGFELPTKFIVVDQRRKNNSSGTISISRGNAAWTRDTLSLRNDGTATALIVIQLLKGT